VNLKKVLALIVVVLMCSVLLTACDGGGIAEPEDKNGEVVFNLGRTWEEKSWDPASFTQLYDIFLAHMVYESLAKLNVDGTVEPELAESWDISDDGLTYTFNLRKGVKWHHDYGEFTSEDVKFTLERHADPEVGSINAENIHLDNIASIDTPDEHTVEITLKQIDVDFLTRLALYHGNMVCKAAYDDKGLDEMKLFPVGTGPYRYDQGTPGTKTEVVRFEDYWGEVTGNIDRVTATIISDENTLYSALESGEIHLYQCFDKDKTVEFKEKGFTVNKVPFNQVLYIGMNMQHEPFTDPLVREALFCAIDPEVFIDDLYYGTETTVGSYIPPNSKYAIKDHFKSTYDPERAKELLAEAGYPDGLDITLWSINDEISPPPANITHSQLEAAGFNCEMQLIEAVVFFDMCRAGEAPLWLLYNDTPPIADFTMTRYMSASYPGNNWSGIQDDEYDSLVNKALNVETEDEKAHYFAEAQKRLMSLNVLYPVATMSWDVLTTDKLGGEFVVRGDGSFHLYNAVMETE